MKSGRSPSSSAVCWRTKGGESEGVHVLLVAPDDDTAVRTALDGADPRRLCRGRTRPDRRHGGRARREPHLSAYQGALEGEVADRHDRGRLLTERPALHPPELGGRRRPRLRAGFVLLSHAPKHSQGGIHVVQQSPDQARHRRRRQDRARPASAGACRKTPTIAWSRRASRNASVDGVANFSDHRGDAGRRIVAIDARVALPAAAGSLSGRARGPRSRQARLPRKAARRHRQRGRGPEGARCGQGRVALRELAFALRAGGRGRDGRSSQARPCATAGLHLEGGCRAAGIPDRHGSGSRAASAYSIPASTALSIVTHILPPLHITRRTLDFPGQPGRAGRGPAWTLQAQAA